MDSIKIIRVEETDSTNRLLHEYTGDEGKVMTVAVAEHQTAGRGQGTNHWESEAGQNLLFSIMVRPEALPVQRQFVMLEAGALAIKDVLEEYAGGITIKWPNDVYWHDKKISGTLSECTVSRGMTGRCIIGTGININQQEFTDYAPNPVSLRQITGHNTDRTELLGKLLARFSEYLGMVNARRYDDIDRMYAGALYRKEGVFEYEDAAGRFMAEIERIEPNGHIVLKRTDGSTSTYAFKEVKFVNI